jgi:hypothetical protein
LEQIVEFEAELAHELADRGVALVDELSPVLGQLPVRKCIPDRPATTAQPRRGLVELDDVASLIEAVTGSEPG